MMRYFGSTDLDLYIVIAILSIAILAVWWRKRSFSYVFFFTIFSIYLAIGLIQVIFPFVIHGNGDNWPFRLSLNLIPFDFGGCGQLPGECLTQVFQNILLTIPFGFGLRFLTRFKARNIFWIALAVGLSTEGIQLVISLVFQSAFRSVDINDTLLNAFGVLVGYAAFNIFAWLYRTLLARLAIHPTGIFAYVNEVCE
jgi:glycopeptide antibiotics resistance protein